MINNSSKVGLLLAAACMATSAHAVDINWSGFGTLGVGQTLNNDEQRYRARLMVVFSVLAGIFSMMGIYGVTSRSVARRIREMGIRIALGAERTQVRGLILRQAGRIAVVGAILGVLVSIIASRFIEDLLFGVSRTDPIALLGIGLLVGLASVLASWAPSRRATKVDPMVALRTE